MSGFFRAVVNEPRSHGVECIPDGAHWDGTSTFEVRGLSSANTLTGVPSLSLPGPLKAPTQRPLQRFAGPRHGARLRASANYSRVTQPIKKMHIAPRGSRSGLVSMQSRKHFSCRRSQWKSVSTSLIVSVA